jgi:hypothetical protein
MRDTVEGFIGDGGNAAFLSGNTSFWQVRLEDPTPEGPAATMVGYKGFFKQDPVYGTDRVGELTSIWSDHLIERPENHMTGVSFARGGYHRIGKRATAGAGGYTIHRPGHWLFDGTGLGYGDLLGAGATTVGYECESLCDFTYRDGLPYPTGVDGTPAELQILGTSPPPITETCASAVRRRQARRARWSSVASPLRRQRPRDVERISYSTAVLCLHSSRRWHGRRPPQAARTGPTGWPAEDPRSSRSPATSSTASATTTGPPCSPISWAYNH